MKKLILKTSSAIRLSLLTKLLVMRSLSLYPKRLNFGAFKVIAIVIFSTAFAINASAINYYSKSTGNLNLVASWGTNTDGSGTAPGNFTTANNVFFIRNNATPTIGANWTVSGGTSKIVVGDGTNACNFTIPATFTYTGTVDVSNAGTLTITNTTLPTIATLGTTSSTVVFNSGVAETIPVEAYCNLTISGGGTDAVAGDFGVTGMLTISSGSILNLGTSTLTAVGTTSGTGTLRTGTDTTPIPSGETWSFSVAYNGNTQNVVAGTYSLNLTLSGTGTKTGVGNITVGNDFTFSLGSAASNFYPANGSVLTVGNDFIATLGNYDFNNATGTSSINLGGNFSNTGATIQTSGTGTNGIITMAGPSTAAAPQTFTNTSTANIKWINFVVANGAAMQLNSDMPLELESATNFQGSLTVQSGGTLNMQGFDIVPTNNDAPSGTTTTNFTISSGATLMLSKSTGISGAVPAATVTQTYSSLANYEFDGTAAAVTGTFTTTPTALTVNNLTINSTNTVTASQAFSVTGTLSITGTFNMGTNLLSAVGTPAGTGTLTTQNTSTAPIPSGKTWTGPVTFNGAAAQSIPAGTYVALTISPAFTNVAQGNISQSGTFTIGTGATLSMGTNLLTAIGTQAGAGALTTQNTSAAPLPSGLTWTWPVTFNGAAAQSIPAGTYANLTVSAAAVNVAQGNISQSGTFTIGTGATLSMGTNRLASLGTQSGAGSLTTQNTASATPIPSGTTWTWPVTYNATSGTQTVVPGTYSTLSFSGNAVKTAATGTINVSGAWNSAGGNVDLSTNAVTLNFTGATAQAITDAGSNGGAGLTFKTVNFSGAGTKTLTTGPFSLSNTGVLTMVGSSTLATGGVLTLNSGASSSATIATIPSGASITGNVNVQRYFSGGAVATQRAYRLIGFPVNSNSITNNAGSTAYYNFAGVSNSLYTGGPAGATGGFTVNNPGASTVFLYRENTPPNTGSFNNGNYKGVAALGVNPFNVINANSTFSLWSGGGAMVYYVGSKTGGAYNTKTLGVFPDPDNTVMVSTGTLNQGIQPVKLWYNASLNFTFTSPATAGDLGFALVGNPYASTIDWDTYSSSVATAGIYAQSGIINTVYQYNYSSKNFGAYQAGTGGGLGTNNSSRYIGSGQGFFVKTTVANARLTFNEIAKTTVQPNSLGSTKFLMGMPVATVAQPLLRVKIAQDKINTDDIMILFESDKSNGYDPEFDADDISGIGSQIGISSYAQANGRKLAINHMATVTANTRVKLFVTSTVSGVDTLSVSGLETLDKRYSMYLIDHFKKDSVLFTSAQPYIFNITTTDTTSFGSTRFELVFHIDQAYNKYKLLSFNAKKLGKTVQVTWKVENEQNHTGFTLQRADGSQKFITFQNTYSLQSDGRGTYTYTDIDPLKSSKYRVMQNDAFERITYSDIVSINTESTSGNISPITLYPNPTVSSIQITLNTSVSGENIHLVILNSSGRIMISKDISKGSLIQNVSSFMPGTYVVEVSDTVTKKVIGNKKFIKL